MTVPVRSAAQLLPADFQTEIYERASYFAHLPPALRPPFGAADCDRLLFGSLHRAEDIDLLRRGKAAPELLELRPDNYVSPRALQEALRQGCSIRIRNVCRLAPALADWLADLGSVFTAATEANLYATIGHEPALNPHQDGHDVFAYQVHGSKTWFVAPPADNQISLPMEQQASDKVGLPEKYETFNLTPGDLLYLPRGFVHHTEWRSGISIHLALRVQPVRWHDLLASMAEHAALDQEALRVSVDRIGGREQRERLEILFAAFEDRKAVRLAYAKALGNKRALQDAYRQSWRVDSLQALESSIAAKVQALVACDGARLEQAE